MKVYFHSNGGLIDSPYFYYTFTNSPKGVNYISARGHVSDVLIDMKKQRAVKAIIELVKIVFNFTKMSIVNCSNVPDIEKHIDLIHSFNTIPITDKPFIVEMESYHSLFIGGTMDKSSVGKVSKLLSEKQCKKIIFWTENAYNNFFNLNIDKKLKEKSIILYPAVPLNKQNKFHNKPTIGFIARNFINKGGELVVPVMKDFVKAKRANAIIITDVDLVKEKNPEIYNSYSRYINFQKLMPRDEMNKKIMPKIDILFYPGFSDSYGFIFPEAASFGIPVITMDGVARKEVVHSGSSGYVVSKKLQSNGFPIGLDAQEKENIIFDFHVALTNLISNKNLRKEMSDYNYNLVKNGIFSIKKRNKELLKIYNEAMK